MDSQLVGILINAGVAGVFACLFVLGLVVPRSVVTDMKAEIAELKQAITAERDRADAAVAAASATKDILTAIQLGRDLGKARDGP